VRAPTLHNRINLVVITETTLDIHRYICSALFGRPHLLDELDSVSIGISHHSPQSPRALTSRRYHGATGVFNRGYRIQYRLNFEAESHPGITSTIFVWIKLQDYPTQTCGQVFRSDTMALKSKLNTQRCVESSGPTQIRRAKDNKVQ
jgi:hypothetical protein